MSREPRVLVIIPTFDELESLPVIIGRLRAAVPDADLLVVDDDSPDGTGALADRLALNDPHLLVEHRAARSGLGPAYLSGFHRGIELGYDVLVEIDADGSHPPDRLPEMIRRLWADPFAALVIGSRWMKGGSVVNWPLRRELLSRAANLYAKVALGVSVQDMTAGFRAIRATAIEAMDLSSIKSKGYCFQIDLTIRVVDSGGGVIEVPIEFREREAGTSKMSGAIVREAMGMVTVWGFQRRLRQLTGCTPSGRGRSAAS